MSILHEWTIANCRCKNKNTKTQKHKQSKQSNKQRKSMARPARVIPGLTMTLVGTAFKMKIVNDGTQINLEKKAPYGI